MELIELELVQSCSSGELELKDGDLTGIRLVLRQVKAFTIGNSGI